MPNIAIIMRSMNEMPYVQTALEMLKKQTVQDFELFAIDSGSTDGSVDVLKAHCDENHFTQIAPADYIPGKVLNEAIARTHHPIIIFLNADSIPCSDDWLERLIQPLLDERADATMSRQIARPDARFIVTYDYQRAYDPKNIKGDNADFFSAVACAFKRELWEKNAFRTHGYAEDVAWAAACRNNNARFLLVSDSVVEHSHNYSLKGLHRKKFRHGLTFAELYNQQPNLLKQLYRYTREIIRDLLYAIRKGQLQTIPYNIAYRTVIHAGLHQGLVTAKKEAGKTAKYDQLKKPI
jgi:rhamnosyltransferase